MAELELDEEVLETLKKLIADDKLSEALKIVFQLGYEKGRHDKWETEEGRRALLDGNQPS